VEQGEETGDRPTIARALDYLLRTYRDADGKPATVDQVAAAIDTKGVSAYYINALRSGKKRNPTADTLRTLANFFGVKAGFFFDPPPEGDGVTAIDVPPATDDTTTAPPETGPATTTIADVSDTNVQVNLAARLEYLFNLRVQDNGQPWSMRQVSAAAKAQGVPLSVGFLHDLRRGVKDNPTKQQLECLARVFKVWPGYFFESDERLAEANTRLQLQDALDNRDIARIAMRARDLTPRELNMVNALIDSALRDTEKNPTSDEGSG
jgi:transcriptional regulator with XRE-family HTH domain